MSDNNSQLDQRVYEMAQVLSAIKQGQDDMHARLFTDGGGILPTMFVKLNTMEKEMTAKANAADLIALSGAVATKANAADIVVIKDALSTIKEKRAYHIGYAAGAGSVATLMLKYLAGKVGLHL